MNVGRIYKHRKQIFIDHKYQMCKYELFDYSILNNILHYQKRGPGKKYSVNECWIMVDTETSKKPYSEHNHVCAWTISIRAFDVNIVTLYGTKPSECIDCIDTIHKSMKGTRTHFYIHNLNYDYTFLRKFMFRKWGEPSNQLNIKSHAILFIEFSNGIVFRDSLVLFQRTLEKTANDFEVEHRKAVGKWDYNKIRNQGEEFTTDELLYIENDTLAGVESLNALALQLKKNVVSMPFTATGIPREELRKRGKANYAKQWYNKNVLSYEQYRKMEMIFHGGYTHANRFICNQVINCEGESYDFSSSYPFVVCSERFPSSRFVDIGDCDIDYILKYKNDYAFMFRLVLIDVEVKPGVCMPGLQSYKCFNRVNCVYDNGRILKADYLEIWLNEVDLSVLATQYTYNTNSHCYDVEYAHKDYLPRWYTDYVYELYEAKTYLKDSDLIAYRLAKAKLNASAFGITCMKNIQINIIEDYKTGDFKEDEEQDPETVYNKFIHNKNNIFLYQIGTWVTSFAFRNLHLLTHAVASDGTILYCDTDSVYATKFNHESIKIYNDLARKKLEANGYKPVLYKGREYILGVAEHDSDFTQFITLHAKCYCKRETDGLHITVAGVPKRAAEQLNDDISNFQPGFIFKGNQSGKLTHKYFYVDDIYIDENGNETGDSINLSPCDYLLGYDNDNPISTLFDEKFNINIEEFIQIYEE